MSAGPELSVILVTPDRYETIRRTIAWLRAQTVRESIEVVIVAPSREVLQPDEEELAAFHGFQVVEVGTVRSVAAGNAAGVRAASAPVVVFGEDHSYPQPGWAEALIEAHRGPWAAVGPVVANANPRSAVSWADFLPGYGPWLDPTPGGPVTYLPGHNSSYKRDLLLELGDDLDPMLNAESVLHWELGARGHELYLEPRAKTRHFNFSRLPIYLHATFLHARTFAAERARGGRWGTLRRVAYAGAWPLIPLVRIRRVFRDVGRAREHGVMPRVLPPVLLGLVVSALGEAAGYLLGPGEAPERVSAYEFHRDRHVTRRDRAAMAAAVPP
ncbi:MAG TPA: glycosyltransferase [Thermoleophilaceae bacterium]